MSQAEKTHVIKMMGGESYEISRDTFHKLEGKKGLIYVPEIDTVINMQSISSIPPIALSTRNRIALHDGGFAIKKFGIWIDELSGANLNSRHYPYLARDLTKQEYDELEQHKSQRLPETYKQIGKTQTAHPVNKGDVGW